ncbi:zinc-dependent peptidase [Pseudoduganella sp. LjRoot289]|uniref:M90 family metallopeptidase n=1 Tax=Pseudoduganella sp. LjRoot289 TaxID=3342314 RepID=UPI003ECEFFA6
MDALLWLPVVALALAVPLYLPRWRLRRALARPWPEAAEAVLQRNIPVYASMGEDLRGQLRRLVKQFLHQKTFVGCEGLQVDEEMRYTIAGQACLLLLNRPSKVYRALHTILVYPSAFLVPRKQLDAGGVVTDHHQTLLGESWDDGRVVLSWADVKRGYRDWTDGHNVVLHEFAHQLDSESGSSNGAPYLGSKDSYRSWSAVLSRDYDNLRYDAYYGRQDSVLDHYGATSPAEFFAVATETFFEKPWQMAERHAALFEEFGKYYRVDPRLWLARPAPPAAEAPQPLPAGGRGASYAIASW